MLNGIASVYDNLTAEGFEDERYPNDLPRLCAELARQCDFSSAVLDPGPGTGLFGMVLHHQQKATSQPLSRLWGIERSLENGRPES